MKVEFRSYLLVDGYFRDRSVLSFPPAVDGVPPLGALVVKVPVCAGIDIRTGVVVGLRSGQVDVMWNPWIQRPDIADYELRGRLGILTAALRRSISEAARLQGGVQQGPQAVDCHLAERGEEEQCKAASPQPCRKT